MTQWVRKKNKYLPLTDRQRDCLAGYWLGETQAQTGTRLGISAAAVNGHRSTAKLKLQAATLMEAAKRAVRLGEIKGTVGRNAS